MSELGRVKCVVWLQQFFFVCRREKLWKRCSQLRDELKQGQHICLCTVVMR